MTNGKLVNTIYKSSFSDFINTTPNEILGTLGDLYHGDLNTNSREAWKDEIIILQNALTPWKDEDAEILFEYSIPRLGKRIDVVLLLRGMIFCLEFKVGQRDALRADMDQVMNYATDLEYFHLHSQGRYIVPILVPTEHTGRTTDFQMSVYGDKREHGDKIYNTVITGKTHLREVIQNVIAHAGASTPGTIRDWEKGPYSPTPSIVEAARVLFENHTVENITRHGADKDDTDKTIRYIQDVIHHSKQNHEKSICFVTGVPGAGKTLVGLQIAVNQTYATNGETTKDEGAVYLSGNGPLVAVLVEALARDNYAKCKRNGEKKKISECQQEVGKFIQIIHRYRDNMLAKLKTPITDHTLEIDPAKAVKMAGAGYSEVEHVAIFDEAQRSWTHQRIANYLKRGGTYGNKLKIADFPMSEAGFLIWSLDQREDWATIVCLVGGGQEINTGEAGITEWINSLNNDFPHWKIYISPKLEEEVYAEGKVNDLLKDYPHVEYADELHLASSKRSFKAEGLSPMISQLLNFGPNTASQCEAVMEQYPIYITRDMDKARRWLRKKARGSERTGILVSKAAARTKPLAVSVLPSGDENAIHWFLDDIYDVRASNCLEDAVTEIQVQGLELDYTCVLWDADMRVNGRKWGYYNFRTGGIQEDGTPKCPKWSPVSNLETQKYMLNAYRVLLTRARQGMVICIPKGCEETYTDGSPIDSTRLPEFYDSTYEYLRSLGIPELEI